MSKTGLSRNELERRHLADQDLFAKILDLALHFQQHPHPTGAPAALLTLLEFHGKWERPTPTPSAPPARPTT